MDDYGLEVTLRLRYKAKPENYSIEDNGDDVTAYEMARIDASNFLEDPESLWERLMSSSDTVITVAPIVTLDD